MKNHSWDLSVRNLKIKNKCVEKINYLYPAPKLNINNKKKDKCVEKINYLYPAPKLNINNIFKGEKKDV